MTVGLCVRQAVPGYCGIQRCTQDYPSTAASFLFFPIIDRDCTTLSYVDISTSTPPTDEVVVACPLARSNNNSCGRAIYIKAVVDPDGGTTHASSSSSTKLMV
jgi:hypothetical protein